MPDRLVRRIMRAAAIVFLAIAARPAAGYEDRSTATVAPDGSGGIYVLDGELPTPIRLRHFLASGAPAPGYPAAGLPIDTIPQPRWRAMASDGFGGAIIAYTSTKTAGSGIHAARATAQLAPAPGWPANGVPGYIGPIGPGIPGIAPDGTGGLFLAWQDFRIDYNDQDIYAQRIDGTGVRAAGWPDTAIAVCDVPGDQFDPVLLSDGAGGCFAVWQDGRNLAGPDDENYDIYAQRIGADGAMLWPTGGIPISRAPDVEWYPTLAGDGAGGAYISWTALPPIGVDQPDRLRVSRVTAAGVLAPGWPADGLEVAPVSRYRTPGLPLLVGDGAEGAYVAWVLGTLDPAGERSSVRLLRLSGTGTVAGGWPAGGVDLESGGGDLGLLGMVSDGEGGAVVSWRRHLDGALSSIRVQRIAPSGGVAPGWPSAGIPIGLAVNDPNMVTDGAGGVTMERQVPATGATRVTRVTRDGVVDPGWPGYPTRSGLFPAYPQPASDAVSIPFAMPALAPLEAKIYDIRGRLVRALVRDSEFPAGLNILTWDGRTDEGRRAASGVYLLRVDHAGRVATTRLVLAR